MNARQLKKQQAQTRQQELELILSAHWERQITKIEAEEALQEILLGFDNTNTRTAQIINEILEKNAINNNRFLKRKKLFSSESLATSFFAKANAMAK